MAPDPTSKKFQVIVIGAGLSGKKHNRKYITGNQNDDYNSITLLIIVQATAGCSHSQTLSAVSSSSQVCLPVRY